MALPKRRKRNKLAQLSLPASFCAHPGCSTLFSNACSMALRHFLALSASRRHSKPSAPGATRIPRITSFRPYSIFRSATAVGPSRARTNLAMQCMPCSTHSGLQNITKVQRKTRSVPLGGPVQTEVIIHVAENREVQEPAGEDRHCRSNPLPSVHTRRSAERGRLVRRHVRLVQMQKQAEGAPQQCTKQLTDLSTILEGHGSCPLVFLG